MLWVEFAVCSVLLVLSAHALCVEGVSLAAVTHIEEGVIGIFFLAVATSFPEIVVGVSSVAHYGRIALGYGDLVGSVIINSLLIIGVDYYAGCGRVLAGSSKMNFMTVFFWATVALVITISAVLRRHFNIFSIGTFGVESFVVAGLYFSYLAKLKKKSSLASEIKKNKNAGAAVVHTDKSVVGMWVKFVLLLGAVMVLGVWMSGIGERIAVTTSLSHTFVGATLLALVTSFPEIAVSLGAMRAGSVDMALGNIFGSNLFDLSILPIMDAFTKGPITAGFTLGQIVVTAMAVLVPVVILCGMKRQGQGRCRVGLDSAVVFVMGIAALAVLFFVE